MGVKSLRWFFFTIFVALLPLVFPYYLNKMSFWELINNKEADILFMGVTFCAVGIGELLESATSDITMPKIPTHVLMGTSIIVVIAATLLYAGISLGKAPSYIDTVCLLIFIISVLLSTGCIALSEGIEKQIMATLLKRQEAKLKQNCGNSAIQLILDSKITREDRNILVTQISEKLESSLSTTQLKQLLGQP